MRLVNVSPMGAVVVPSLGLSLEAGAEFDVGDELGAALLRQSGNYARVVDAADEEE